jgi:hypothetical protein
MAKDEVKLAPELEAAEWDAQIEADAAAGKFTKLAEEALAEYRAGKAQEI